MNFYSVYQAATIRPTYKQLVEAYLLESVLIGEIISDYIDLQRVISNIPTLK